MLRKTLHLTIGGLVAIATVLAFQNCSQPIFSTAGGLQNFQLNSGNGDTYAGKPDEYHNYDAARICSDRGANGQPLPTRVIFVVRRGGQTVAQLVRDNCVDLAAPVDLNLADLSYTPENGGTIVYLGQSYVPHVGGDFDVVSQECPAGATPVAGAQRTNLFRASQALESSDWFVSAGITASLEGSLGSLPRYKIMRNDPANLDYWRRLSQAPSWEPGKTYAFTFFAQKGSVGRALFSGNQDNDNQFSVSFDLETGAGQIRAPAPTGVTNIRTASRPFAGGFILTTYLTAPANAGPSGQMGMGISADSADGIAFYGNVGDYIYATAVLMEEVGAYCAPNGAP